MEDDSSTYIPYLYLPLRIIRCVVKFSQNLAKSNPQLVSDLSFSTVQNPNLSMWQNSIDTWILHPLLIRFPIKIGSRPRNFWSQTNANAMIHNIFIEVHAPIFDYSIYPAIILSLSVSVNSSWRYLRQSKSSCPEPKYSLSYVIIQDSLLNPTRCHLHKTTVKWLHHNKHQRPIILPKGPMLIV